MATEEKPIELYECTFSDCNSGIRTKMEQNFSGRIYTRRSIVCKKCNITGVCGSQSSSLYAFGKGIKEGQTCFVSGCCFEGEWKAVKKDEKVSKVFLHVVGFSKFDVAGCSFKNLASNLASAGIICSDVDETTISSCSFENCFGADGGCVAAEPIADWQNEMTLLKILECKMEGNEKNCEHSQKDEPNNSGAMIFARKVKNVNLTVGYYGDNVVIANHTSLADERSGGVVIECADLLFLNCTKLISLNGASGGAIFVNLDVKSVELRDVTIEKCTAIQVGNTDKSGRGEAIFVADYIPKNTSNFMTCPDSTISHNLPSSDSYISICIIGCSISNCLAAEGGAIFLETFECDGTQRKKLSIDKSNFTGNKASTDGGALMIREKKNRNSASNSEISKIESNSSVSTNAYDWPVMPCGSAISIAGANDLEISAVSDEQSEYLLSSSSTEYSNNTHAAIYAAKGSKVKSDNDMFMNNIEKDDDNMFVLVDISCETSLIDVTNPNNVRPQWLCDESCKRHSTSSTQALKCEFFPATRIEPNYSSILRKKPLLFPQIEFKGYYLYPLKTPVLWIGKSERTDENSKEGISVELESKKESNSTSQFKFYSKGEIDISNFEDSNPLFVILHVSVDGGESWSDGVKIFIAKEMFPTFAIVLIVIAFVAVICVGTFIIIFCVRRKKRDYNRLSKY
ncbi:uncharacterized protein MONOS_3741 [Monocercomonoides exilis]|uniref:uncharacterized protein n=1 Tax=Monocercomonoides exilis TaxID=2049356 RepID=UPI00355A5804|nr:hypothetical protein MONOS_3741 [Monocercomonoides exilis]|eukprot:MONOS_3741.1-p1 / transcript=MONOS_3741.1 / gene=MONOS_3741 / organism=Monocercomonoides_exilis_PA203 / gene_product=unspecified product / transcript_product=unspecified product / location=Mono_scaffold00091:38917-41073(-) / protein_length=684 / sequence_SO=supercontig / SO=protein_coding / is_pseudo=false